MNNCIVNLGFQDIIDIRNEKILYTEILCYNIADERIDEIERKYRQNRSIREIDLDIIREAFRFIARNNLRNRYFGINIFEKSVEIGDYKVDTVKLIEDIADEYKINRGHIYIELNEDTDIESSVVKKRIEKFKEKGFKIALDDWGRKRGSMFSIIDDIEKRYIDVVKIDIDVLRAMKRKESKSVEHLINIISSLKKLCDSSDKKVVIEGVENSEDERIVDRCGIIYLQGFKYCHKLSEDEWLSKNKEKSV